MNQRSATFLCAVIVVIPSAILAQGIQTPVIRLDVAGEWQERADWLADPNLHEQWTFYDQPSSTMLHVRRTRQPFKQETLPDLMGQLKTIEASLTERPGFARFLASAFFLFPAGYVEEVAAVFDPAPMLVGQAARILAYKSPERARARSRKAPKMWELKKATGDAEWFYVSQLTPGFITKNFAGGQATEEEYARLRLTRSEQRSFGAGGALVFELETEKPAVAKAIERFGMPQELKAQKVRYGWIMYSPEGFSDSGQVVSIVFATPANSGIDCEALLASVSTP